MKPQQLKYPFTWEARRPLISDRVFFVPKCYEGYEQYPVPTWEELFGKQAPIHIEYCTGNGTWILEKALKHPDIHWIAVERRFERVRKIWSKMRNFSLQNLFIVCGEAQTFTRYYLPSQSVQEIFINFPDPWPKLRHAKNRLIQEPFISDMARACADGGGMMIATDHAPYAQQVTQQMNANLHWSSSLPPPFFVTEWEGYGTSYFDSLWRSQGLTIHYMHFVKQESAT